MRVFVIACLCVCMYLSAAAFIGVTDRLKNYRFFNCMNFWYISMEEYSMRLLGAPCFSFINSNHFSSVFQISSTVDYRLIFLSTNYHLSDWRLGSPRGPLARPGDRYLPLTLRFCPCFYLMTVLIFSRHRPPFPFLLLPFLPHHRHIQQIYSFRANFNTSGLSCNSILSASIN